MDNLYVALFPFRLHPADHCLTSNEFQTDVSMTLDQVKKKGPHVDIN